METVMIDFMIAAVIAALVNIGLLGITITTYIQNMRLLKSYYTLGLVLVATLLLIQNGVIVLFWSTLYMYSPELMKSADMVSHYLFVINIVQTIGLAILVWITRR
jgi:hypothetical protein